MTVNICDWRKIAINIAPFLLLFFVDYNLENQKIFIFLLLTVSYVLVTAIEITVNEKMGSMIDAVELFFSSFVCFALSQYMILSFGEIMQMEMKMWMVNILLFLTVHFLVFGVCGNVKWTCMIVHLVIMIISFADYLVLSFRNNEITLADFTAYKTGLSVAKNYRPEIVSRCLYATLGSFICVRFISKIKVPKKNKKKERWISVTVGMALGLIFCLLCQNREVKVFGRLGSTQNGYFTNLALQVRDSYVAKPEGYSVQRVQDIYQSNMVELQSEESIFPTIIVIMNESFSDLSVLGEIETNQEAMSFYHSLKENTIKGTALASVYGGQTANSEWEFLTENTMGFLPNGSVVYQQYLKEKPITILDKLHENGYTCIGMHPFRAQSYNRDKAFRKMGFDEMYFLEAFEGKKMIRGGISDEEFYDKIIERFEEAQDEKLFFFGITMQNHGGYSASPEEFEFTIQTKDFNYDDVNCYLSLIHESDLALEKLIRYFEKQDRPVEIVFFGDHQPALNEDFINILMSQNPSENEVEETQKMYQVPFFVWTNYAIEAKDDVLTDFGKLPIYMFENAGIALSNKESFLKNSSKTVQAINPFGFYSVLDDKWKNFKDASEEESKILTEYECIQYYEMFDKR